MRQGESSQHLGAARKLHHVWAAASEGAGPPQRLGDAKPVAFLSRGGWSPEQGVVKFRADRPTAARLERWVPEEVKDAAATRPLPPALQVVQPENFSFIKKDKTPRGASESEPQPPTRTPPSISPGHVPRLRRTGTELRGWQRVRSPLAGPASPGAGRPAAGEAGRTPERDLGLDGIRGAGVSLVCFGFRTATPSSVSLWWSRPWILHVLRGPGTGVSRGQGDRRSRRSDDLRIPFLPSRISLADCQSAPLSPLVFISSCLPLNTGVSPAPSFD